jgi:streptogramin lyase
MQVLGSWRWPGLVVTLGLGLMTAACGGESGVSAAKSKPSPSVVAARPGQTVPLPSRLAARIQLPTDGDSLVELGGSVWIKSETGVLIRVDARTNRVLGTVQLDDRGLPFRRHCQGLGSDGQSVWTCATNLKTTPVVRLDPVTGKVQEKFAVDKSYDQLRMPYVDGRIWVLVDGGKTLAGLRSGGNVLRLPLEKQYSNVTGSGDDLVLASTLENSVVRVDAQSGKVLASADVQQAGVLSGTDEDVWIGSAEGLLRLDAKSLRRKAVYKELSPQISGDVVALPDEVWVRLKGERFLYRIDPATNEVTDFVKADPNLSSGSVLVTDDAIWTTAYDNQRLLRLHR